MLILTIMRLKRPGDSRKIGFRLWMLWFDLKVIRSLQIYIGNQQICVNISIIDLVTRDMSSRQCLVARLLELGKFVIRTKYVMNDLKSSRGILLGGVLSVNLYGRNF